MKVYAISDFHLCISGAKPMEIFGGGWKNYLENIKTDWFQKVTDKDVVLIAGDISWAMKLDEAKRDLVYFDDLPGKKVFIRGNHDYWWQSISNVRQALNENSYALQNDAIKFENVIICGTRGWTVPDKEFKDAQDEKIYNRELLRLEMALKSAKDLQKEGDSIICMIHYPPYLQSKQKSEFVELLIKFGVKACVFGHIHSNIGKYKLYENLFGIDFYLTSCDLTMNKLQLIKI